MQKVIFAAFFLMLGPLGGPLASPLSTPVQLRVVSRSSLCCISFHSPPHTSFVSPSPSSLFSLLKSFIFLFMSPSPSLPSSQSESFIPHASLLNFCLIAHHPLLSKLYFVPLFSSSYFLMPIFPCATSHTVLIPSILPFIHLSALMAVTLETWISCQCSLSAA